MRAAGLRDVRRDLLGAFDRLNAAQAPGDRRFAALSRAPWRPDGRGGRMRKLEGDGVYLWLKPHDIQGPS
jgi:hypothetical protein